MQLSSQSGSSSHRMLAAMCSPRVLNAATLRVASLRKPRKLRRSTAAARKFSVLSKAETEKAERTEDPNIVEGYNINEPDLWENEIVATGLQVAGLAAVVSVVVALVYLASPLITYVLDIYPGAADVGLPESIFEP